MLSLGVFHLGVLSMFFVHVYLHMRKLLSWKILGVVIYICMVATAFLCMFFVGDKSLFRQPR